MRRKRGFEGIKNQLRQIKTSAETICNPSEDLEKVKKALLNVLEGEVEVEEIGEGLYQLRVEGNGPKSIDKILHGFERRRVLMAVRKHLKSRVQNGKTEFLLNKQAAYVGVVSIWEEGESVLGPIKATISVPDIYGLIEWMTSF
jgi:predicted RNA binding protein with dsRBD fold (UPF0201 family)